MEKESDAEKNSDVVKESDHFKDFTITLKAPSLWKSCRLLYTICAFFASMNLMFVKFNISMALVCVAEAGVKNYTTVSPEILNKATQGHIISAFFYGYLLSLLIGGWLSQTLSAKTCFVAGNAVSGILNFLIPVSAVGGQWYLFTIRLLQGVFMGIMLPSIELLFSSWSHVEERTKLVTFSFIGYTVGVVFVNPVASLFCYLDPTMGWSNIFYFTGTLMTTCGIAYYFLVFDSVHKHPRISTQEKEYILSGTSLEDKKKEIPYKIIFTSIPVYAYLITHGCQVFGYAALSSTLPFFLKEALNLNVVQNGLLSAAPSIFSTISRLLIGQCFNPLRRLTRMSLTRFRKVNHVIGTLLPAAFFFAISFMSNDYKTAIVVLLCLVESVCDFGYCGSYAPSLIDLAPSYIGFLSGIASAVASLPFIVVAQIFGHLTNEGTIEEWKIMWYASMGAYCFGCIVYVSLGTSVKQRWG